MTPHPFRVRYPHLTPDDSDLWSQYLEIHKPTHASFLYDVSVGDGRDPGPDFPQNIRDMALQLSKRRIDVIGLSSDHIEIFEVTQSAGLRACGQVFVYKFLLNQDWHPDAPITTTILCRSCQSDIAPMLSSHHITLIVIPLPNRAQNAIS
jgi:hypothetical protein